MCCWKNRTGLKSWSEQFINQISEVVNLFSQNGNDCGIADIVDQVYQG
jgi:hypothetical protein